jgi:hypothetical protein
LAITLGMLAYGGLKIKKRLAKSEDNILKNGPSPSTASRPHLSHRAPSLVDFIRSRIKRMVIEGATGAMLTGLLMGRDNFLQKFIEGFRSGGRHSNGRLARPVNGRLGPTPKGTGPSEGLDI